MIEADGLTKRYGQTLAVDDLSFQVRPGRVTGFLGPNGAGKSTTMRMILGLDRPNSGTVRIDGQPYRSLHRPLHTVGALLDAKWVHPNRSARAHLLWLAKSNKISTRRVDEVLGLVGLSAVAGRRAGGFSLGMSQRLGIAAALLGDPRVLLFDEPVNGLDPEGILWIREFMHGLAAEGRTVFVSSHLLSEMSLTAQDLIVVGRGKLIAQSTTAEFIAQAGDNAVRVRSPHADTLRLALLDQGFEVQVDGQALVVPGASTDQVGDIAGANGVVLHELSAQAGSLEQAFMRITGDAVEYRTDAPALATDPTAAAVAAAAAADPDATIQLTHSGKK
jgi:ABC-2 type transport system ATP-binding protein